MSWGPSMLTDEEFDEMADLLNIIERIPTVDIPAEIPTESSED